MKAIKSHLIAFVICLSLFSGCGNTPIPEPVSKPKPVTVLTATISEKAVLYEVIGHAEPAEITKVGPKTGGLVLTLSVTEGQTVQEGAVLATLDTSGQAEADLTFRQQGVAEVTLVSPKAGIVSVLPIRAGELVSAGTPVVVLRSADSIMKFHVPDSFSGKLTAGMPLTIRPVADLEDTKEIIASISKIDEIADAASRSLGVEAVTDSFLLSGSPLMASLEIERRSGIWIPIDAILSGESDYVYTATEGKATRREISILGYHGFDALVSGIEAGEWVITGNAGSLKPFEPVIVLTAKEGQ